MSQNLAEFVQRYSRGDVQMSNQIGWLAGKYPRFIYTNCKYGGGLQGAGFGERYFRLYQCFRTHSSRRGFERALLLAS